MGSQDPKQASMHQVLTFHTEEWYRDLSGCCFPTEFVPVTSNEAIALLSAANSLAQPHEEQELRTLSYKVEHAVASLAGQMGVSVRVGNVSPKDGTEVQFDVYEKELKCAVVNGCCESNHKLIAWSVAIIQSLKCANHKDVMMVLQKSRNVQQLFQKRLQFAPAFDLCIALRAWNPHLQHDMQFRCCVHNGSLTAISQYNQFCYFPTLKLHQEELRQLIQDFWIKELHPKVKSGSYIVGIGVLPDKQIVVTSLQPFSEGTSIGLFDWVEDLTILQDGPFEFRIRTEPMEDVEEFASLLLDDAFKIQ